MRRISHSSEEEHNESVKRYEAFIANAATSGYFDVEELEGIVDYYLHRGQTKNSSTALEFGLKLHPNSLSLRIKRAKIYLATGETKKAYTLLESLGQQNDYELILLKIDALQKLGRKQESYALCDTLLSNDNGDIDQLSLEIAYIFLSDFDIESALKYLQIGEQFNPLNDELLYELALCYEHQGDKVKAADTYSRIIKIEPYSAEAWFNLAQMYFASNQLDDALHAFEYARTINPFDALTCMQKGHAHFQKQEYQEALEEFFAYEEMTDHGGHTYLFIGECYERLEKYTDAINYYMKVLGQDPDNFDALIGLTVCHLEQDLYHESMPYIKRAIELQNDDADAWIYFAEALMGIEDSATALLAYLKSIDFNPNQPDTLMNIAAILMDQHEYELALGYYQQALAIDEYHELENIHVFMAVAYHLVGNAEESQVSLAKAMEENLDAMTLFQAIIRTESDTDSRKFSHNAT